ncbi:MAG: hypothetical protein RI932_1548 [Pseudomonadota bacterium]|jgi:TonB family protein
MIDPSLYLTPSTQPDPVDFRRLTKILWFRGNSAPVDESESRRSGSWMFFQNQNKRFLLAMAMLIAGCVSPRLGKQPAQSIMNQQSKTDSKTPSLAMQGTPVQSQDQSKNSESGGAQAVEQSPSSEDQMPSVKTNAKVGSPPVGTVSESLSDTVVEGGLSKKTVGRVLQSNRANILNCYNKELINNPEAQGLVLTKIDITNSGKVAAVSVLQSDLGDVEFENCIVSTIKRWKFPTPRGGKEVRVSHPFRFSP